MKRRVRDPITSYNKRVEAFGNFLNAIGVGLIGFALLRPAVENVNGLGLSAVLWVTFRLAFHGAQHYVLTKLKKEEPSDEPQP